MNKTITLLLAGIFCTNLISGQSDTIHLGSADDSADLKTKSHSLYAGLGAGNNMMYLGSTISQDQPYNYGSVTYGFRDALYASVTSVHLSGKKPFSAFYAASLSYAKTFNSWFDLAVSVTGYDVAKDLRDTLFGNFLYNDLTVGIDWKVLYTKLSAGALMNGSLNGYYQVRNSRFFDIPVSAGDRFSLSLDPYVNVVLGTTTTYESSGKTITTGNPFKSKGSTKTITTTKATTVFGVMETDIGLPVAFNAPKFTVEIEPGYVLPVYNDPEYPGTKGFLIMISGYFRIF